MDFIKGLPKLEDKDIILVVVYWFIKYGHFIFMSHPFTTQNMIKMFIDHLYMFHSLLVTIVTNSDRVFTSFF